ncbi:TNF receptor-associated factor 3-like isoform X2 [Dysidea avara]|uniref:TNF receptor-associated factor 3-like isoform X2 n=1 Tax=Dysidea avara TaxID=196820 RepID=UPI0033280FB3
MADCGGCDYQFVGDPPDEVICRICQYPSRNPYLTVCCGHVLCKSCLDGCIANSRACPVCRSKKFKSYINKQIDRKVRSLLVYCDKKEEGCQWKGEINDVNDHAYNYCQFQKVYCPNDCGELVQRQKISYHTEYECMYRIIECGHCQYRGKFCYVIYQHLEECPKFPLPCPNCCNTSITILRENLNAHEEVCPLAKVKCRYYELGCNSFITRRDLKGHNKSNVQYHLNLVMNDRYSLKSKLARVTEELEKTKDKLECVSNELEHTQCNYEQRLRCQKKSTERAEDAKFQKRIDIIEGVIAAAATPAQEVDEEI